MSAESAVETAVNTAVQLCRARTPFTGIRIVRSVAAPAPADDDEGWLPVLEVVIMDRADDDVEADRRIRIENVAGAPWPYSWPFGEPVTIAEARQLAAMLTLAADTLGSEL